MSRRAQPAEPHKAVDQTEAMERGAANAGAGSTPTNEEIARRAYEIYLYRGRRHGHDLHDWLEAERQLRGRKAR
jgi:hypothetical protein